LIRDEEGMVLIGFDMRMVEGEGGCDVEGVASKLVLVWVEEFDERRREGVGGCP
jgi:hypothetical protein